MNACADAIVDSPSSGLDAPDQPPDELSRAALRRSGLLRTGQGAKLARGDVPERRRSEQQLGEQALELALGYRFSEPELLTLALTHPSYRNEKQEVREDNQRLEFLGDLVLGLAVGELLLARLPQAREGQLSVLKAQLVRERTLAVVAQELALGGALRLGRGEARSGGRERASLLADALEAVLGAIFLDGGYDAARAVVHGRWEAHVVALVDGLAGQAVSTGALVETTRNFKTALQEWLARRQAPVPRYALLREEGPANAPRFCVQVEATLGAASMAATGEGGSVRGAEHAAAEALYRRLLSPAGPPDGAAAPDGGGLPPAPRDDATARRL